MQEKKKMILLLIIFITISILNIIIFKNIVDSRRFINQQNKYKQESEDLIDKYFQTTTVQNVENKTTFYQVEFCIEKYFYTINKLWTNLAEKKVYGENDTISQSGYNYNEDVAIELLSLIADTYKKEMNLNEANIKEKYSYLKQGKVMINKMYEYDLKEGISMYLVQGYYITDNGTDKQEFEMMLIMDTNNKTFEIYPDEYVIKYSLNEVQIGEKIKGFENVDAIHENGFNKINNVIADDQKIAEDYFYLYKFNMKYDIEEAYNMLEDEYKEKRFGGFSNYQNYIKENYLNLISEMTGYEVNEQNKMYVCVDEKENYYIFIQKDNLLDYKVFLDTYTIDLPGFTEKYQTATTQEKVGMNIEKIVEALNGKDYNYIYSKLADEFKANYFKTYEDFEKYAEITFDIGNEVTYNKYTESENYCTYEITLKGKNKSLTKTIVMKLGEETDFVMSFNVE